MRAGPLLEVLCRHCLELRIVVPRQSRASSFEELEGLIPATFRGHVVRSSVEDLFPAPGICTAGGPEDVVLVTGSIYLLGEVLSRLEPQRGPGEGRLQDF
jgi:dihydrofolate synthase/folylpolyglutamate synthase